MEEEATTKGEEGQEDTVAVVEDMAAVVEDMAAVVDTAAATVEDTAKEDTAVCD